MTCWFVPTGEVKPVQWKLAAIKTYVASSHLDPKDVKVCPVGTQTWVTLASLGVADTIPF